MANQARGAEMQANAYQAFQQRDFDRCIEICKMAYKVIPQSRDLRQLEAQARAEKGDLKGALVAFQTALAMNYNDVACRASYANILRKTGKIEEAKDATFRMHKDRPKLSKLVLFYGLSL